MLVIVGIMLTGVLVGYLLRKLRMAWIQRVIMPLIWILLFLLGIEVGSNKRIIDGLYTLGFEAIVLTVGGIVGTVLGAWALWYYIYGKKGDGV